MVTYRLPGGELVKINYDVSRGRRFVSFTLKGGKVVDAVMVDDGSFEVAYKAWRANNG